MKNPAGMKVSFVTIIYRRPQQMLDNFLLGYHWQTLPPHEVIVVDQNNTDEWQRSVKGVCDRYPLARYIQAPWEGEPDWLNASWGVNVGIKATSPDTDYVAVMGSDMIVGRSLVEVIVGMATRENFLLAPCGWLPPEAPLNNIEEDWELLLDLAGKREGYEKPLKAWCDGTIRATYRDWWFEVRGYDEDMIFKALGGNINRRADRSGLSREIIPWEKAQIMHQWHEPQWELLKNSEVEREWFLERSSKAVNPSEEWGEA